MGGLGIRKRGLSTPLSGIIYTRPSLACGTIPARASSAMPDRAFSSWPARASAAGHAGAVSGQGSRQGTGQMICSFALHGLHFGYDFGDDFGKGHELTIAPVRRTSNANHPCGTLFCLILDQLFFQSVRVGHGIRPL